MTAEENLPTELTVGYRMTAAGASAQGTLPLSTLVADVIQVATDHANALGVGYSRLIEDGNSWVLSRLTIEVDRMPRIHEDYSLTTWIEGFNRHFSERNFELRASGVTIGYMRTVWVAINVATRRPADLSGIAHLQSTVSDRRCPIEPQRRIPSPPADMADVYEVIFRSSDIDFNRHVTTTRYVELAVDSLPLELYDRASTRRFEIAFRHEARWGETARVMTSPVDDDAMDYVTSVVLDDGTQLCSVRHTLQPVQ